MIGRKFFYMIRTFVRELYVKKDLIYSLAVRDFRRSYFGSVLGITWVFVEPGVYIFVMWFFFTKALKFQPSGGYPFVPWLMTSMILWMFFGAAFSSSVVTFSSYSYLLRRQDFNMSILPVVTIIASLFVHGIFMALLVALLFISGLSVSVFWVQSFYYLFATSVLLLGLAWIAGSLSLFVKDTRNIVSVMLQIGFWISPIFWDLKTYPEQFTFLLKLNPLTYLLEGYRKSFLYHEPLWSDVGGLFYFWGLTLVILGCGMVTYKKLRPHFGDML